MRLEECKELSVDRSIKRAPIPKKVIIPLSQHTGEPCAPIVRIGQRVKAGQLIAKSDKFISSMIHASISGKVAKIDKFPHPLLGEFDAIMIEGDGIDDFDSLIKERPGASQLTSDELRNIIKNAGIVGMGGAAFPTHVKLTPPKGKKIDTVILNGAECEPYLTCDHRVMLENAHEVAEGLKIISEIVGAKQSYIAIENNKIGAAFNIEKILRKINQNIKIVILKTKYPQGSEEQLIKVIANREIPPGGLPFDVGMLVHNIATAMAVYEAVYKGKPLYERVITVTGDCINEPGNLLVRIGTSIRDLAESAGGFSEEPAKILTGGPMMGISQSSLDVPVIKNTTGLVFLSKKAVREYREYSCIRCSRCVDVCPVRLIPADIFRLAKKARYMVLSEYNIDDCMECGACAYECPSKIPLVQWIKLGKAELMEINKATTE